MASGDSEAHERGFFLPALVASALTFAVLVAVRFPPMTDLPSHEGLVGLLRHLHDESVPPIYEVRSFAPNLLFYGISYAFSLVVSVDLAVRIVVALSVALSFVGAARLARFAGADRFSPLLIAPLALGFSFHFGMVGSVVGLPIFLFFAPIFADLPFETRSLRAALLAAGSMALLFVAHESLAFAAATVLVVAALLARRRPTFATLAPLGALTLCSVGFRLFSRGDASVFARTFAEQHRNEPFHDPLRRAWGLGNALFGSHPPPLLAVLFAALAGAVVLGLRGAAAFATTSTRRRVLVWSGTALFFAYFAAPWSFGTATMVYHRFAIPAVSLLALSVPIPDLKHRVLFRLASAALPAATLFVLLPQLLDADRLNRDLDVVLRSIEPRSATGLLHVSTGPSTRVFSGSAMGGRVLAERGGRLFPSFVESPISPIRVKASNAADDLALRFGRSPAVLKPTCDFRYLRYLLVHVEVVEAAEQLAGVLAPFARVRAAEGEWLLLESTVERSPIDLAVPPCDGPVLEVR